MIFPIPAVDALALAWFVACWVGYTYFAAFKARKAPSLLVAMYRYRRQWFARMLERENRIVDASALNNLLNAGIFFASTTILILGGLVALLGSTERIISVVAEIPLTREETQLVWQIKIILLIVVFVYAFFKFSWSMRQFNFCSILVGASPEPAEAPDEHAGFVDMAASVASYAADNFNQGLRAYYFALAALTWFLHPWLVFVASAWVVVILYQREFRSRTLYALTQQKQYDPSTD
jgi:uncharacterized membrane protein